MQKATDSHGALALRAGLGLIFIAHGLAKIFIFTMPGTATFFEGAGIPGVLAYPVTALEVIGGALLLLGIYTRWIALALLPVMIGATSALWANGWMFTNAGGGWEFTAFLAVACLAQFLHADDGRYAVGKLLPSRGGAASRGTSATAGRQNVA